MLAVTSIFTFDPTKVVGLLAYLAAGIVCGLAWRGRGSKVWLGLCGFYLFLAVDILIGGRLRLHDALGQTARDEGWYGSRSGLQWLAMGCAMIGAAVLAVTFARVRNRGTRYRVALAAATFSLLLLSLEIVSLHQSDAVLYRHLGPVLLVGYAWALAAAIVILAALPDLPNMPGTYGPPR